MVALPLLSVCLSIGCVCEANLHTCCVFLFRSDVTVVVLGEKAVGKTTFIEHCFVSSYMIYSE